MVGVLELDGIVSAARNVEPAVVAGVNKRPGFLFFVRLGFDEIYDIRMFGVQNNHLGRAAGFTAGLDDAREGVIALEEGNGAGGRAAAREFFSAAAKVGEVRSRSRSVFKEHAFGFRQIENGFHVVRNAVNETGGTLGTGFDADVKPHRRVERHFLVD